MAPFWTRLPIQSCAPTTTSGPLPAELAVTKLVWRSVEIACTSTEMPLASPNASATGLTQSILRASVQMTRSASPRSGTAVESDGDGSADALSDSSPPVVVVVVEESEPPHAVRLTARMAGTKIRASLRILVDPFGRVCDSGHANSEFSGWQHFRKKLQDW